MLELENITAGYGDTVVLRDVSLAVPDAKVVALLGPNGAGKTTLLRVAAGLIKPMSGRVVLNGLSGMNTAYTYYMGFSNSTAQYWETLNSSGAGECYNMKPGTYNMVVASSPR